jgi:LuxR family maltose regulon positive regulatory protein
MLTTTSRFLFYMSHALRRARRGIGEAAINQISDIFPAPPKAIVATPVNELAAIEEEVFLLVEDYHCINISENS